MLSTRRPLTRPERAYLEALKLDAAHARNQALFLGGLWLLLPAYAVLAGRRALDGVAFALSLAILALFVAGLTWLWRPRQAKARTRGWRWGLADWRLVAALGEDLANGRAEVGAPRVLARKESLLGRRLKLEGAGWVRVTAGTYLRAVPGETLAEAAFAPASGTLLALGDRPERLRLQGPEEDIPVEAVEVVEDPAASTAPAPPDEAPEAPRPGIIPFRRREP